MFLWGLIKHKGTAEVFPPNFPCAIHQALALPLAEPGMSRANTVRSVYTLVAAGAEAMAIAHLMNLHQDCLLTITGGAPEAIPIMEVDAEDFDFKGNLNSES